MPTPINVTGITDPAEILRLLRQNGQIQNPVAQPTPSGGSVTYGTLSPDQMNNMAQQAAPQAPPTKGPMLNGMAWGQGMQTLAPLTPPAPAFDMNSYLSSKFGASVPKSITTPLSSSTGGVSGRGGGGGNDVGGIAAALLKGYQQPRDELRKFGKSYAKDINKNYKRDVAKQDQDAVSRGLANSTIRTSMLGGARSRMQDAMLALQDRLASARASLFERQMPSTLQSAELLGNASGGSNIQSILKSLGLA